MPSKNFLRVFDVIVVVIGLFELVYYGGRDDTGVSVSSGGEVEKGGWCGVLGFRERERAMDLQLGMVMKV